MTGDRLRQWRNEADYVDELPWTDAPLTVAKAVNDAAMVFESLKPPAK